MLCRATSRCLVLLVLMLVFTACPPTPGGGGGGGGSASTGGGAGADSLWDLLPAANPLTVSPTVEDGGVSFDAPVDGGTITATGLDGTTYQLVIPGDALLAPTTIVMTPVHFDAQPFGSGKAWGVQFLPDGLVFNTPVKLIITPPAGQVPPMKQQLPFSWSGADDHVALASADPDDARLVLQLIHFSSYGYATATSGVSASLSGVRARIGGTAEERLESAAAELVTAERQRKQAGQEEGGLVDEAAIKKLFADYDAQVVQPRIAAASSSCAAGRLALETVEKAQRQMQLLGLPDSYGYGALLANGLVDAVFGVCLDEEFKLCTDQHIVQRLIPTFLSMERQAQLLGDTTAGKAWESKGADYIYRCHQYRLDVDTKGTSDCDLWTFAEPLAGAVQLKKESAEPESKIVSQDPHGPLISMSYTIGYTDVCMRPQHVVQHDYPFYVNGLAFTLKTDPLQPGKGELADLTLFYFPSQAGGPSNPTLFGSTHDVFTPASCGGPSTYTEPIFNWWSIYLVVIGPNPEYFNTTDGFFFKKWTVYNDGGAVIGRKTVSETFVDQGTTYTSPTKFVLTHTPAK